MRTRTSRSARYSAMARPSLEVDPVRNTSRTPSGSFCRIAAAVRVFPCTTLILRSGRCLVKSTPPPLTNSALLSAPRPNTRTPRASACRMAPAIWRLMKECSRLRKNWNANAGVTHVSPLRWPMLNLSWVNTVPNRRSSTTVSAATGYMGHRNQRGTKGTEEKLRRANGRWNMESSSVPWARKTVSGATSGTATPREARSCRSQLLSSSVPYA
mmetsp:Transcript_8399/g.29458  ORF Transcript_8399/g.29458 Transcript_8399/m.29458 type:complete len:213 (-) Transcript_8399:1129-1767(-)